MTLLPSLNLLFVFAFLLSGITAFPLKTELDILQRFFGEASSVGSLFPDLANWISIIYRGVTEVNKEYPFIFYGTDWLAFAHIVIAILFIGPLRDPVKNIWVIEFGIIACVLVIPLAMICGPIRGIPLFWRIIDCSFGVIGVLPLWFARRFTQRIIEIEEMKTIT